jgi:G3E family GTPase
MKVMIIGGFLGSGKTTTILKLGRRLNDSGKRIAIIVNEIGEIGLDGDTLSGTGITTEELTSGCICCTLRISMQYTLQTLEEEFKPDVVIIEPTGIAFPGQIREEIQNMGLSELSFTPVVTLVDPCRFGTEVSEIPKFIETQIREAEILGVNKVDTAPGERVLATEKMLSELNNEARILKFSAKLGDEQFENLLIQLEAPGLEKSTSEKQNSIEVSEVSAFSTRYALVSSLDQEKGIALAEESLLSIRNRVSEINPGFIGHVKLSIKLPESVVKGSVTSSKEAPQVELVLNRKSAKPELRLLSAITKVPKEALTEIVESSIEGKLREAGIPFEKMEQKGHEHGDDHEQGQGHKTRVEMNTLMKPGMNKIPKIETNIE